MTELVLRTSSFDRHSSSPMNPMFSGFHLDPKRLKSKFSKTSLLTKCGISIIGILFSNKEQTSNINYMSWINLKNTLNEVSRIQETRLYNSTEMMSRKGKFIVID